MQIRRGRKKHDECFQEHILGELWGPWPPRSLKGHQKRREEKGNGKRKKKKKRGKKKRERKVKRKKKDKST